MNICKLKKNECSIVNELLEANELLKEKNLILEAENERLQYAVNIASDGIWDWDIVEDSLYLTPRWFESLYLDNNEIPSTIDEWKKLVHPDDLKRTWDLLQDHIHGGSDVYECENRLKLSTGGYRWNLDRAKVVRRDSNGRALRMIGIDKDITKEKENEQKNRELEIELQQAKKLEAMGMFAGGIAHEFNNILSIAFGLTGLIELTLGKGAAHQQYVDKLNILLTRAKDLVVQILTISRDNDGNVEFIHINTAIEESISELQMSIGFIAKIAMESKCHGLHFLLDKTHFYQLITNLCINANQSIDGDTGEIRILLKTLNSDIERLKFSTLLEVTSVLHIAVIDNGQGIETDSLARIFEPFYSTKKEGTGMGLSIVYSLVRRYNGFIDVESKLGKGSIFNLYFPLNAENSIPIMLDNVSKKIGNGQSTKMAEEYQEATFNKPLKILFVDDEEMILDIFKRALAVLGIDVEVFSCARSALAHFEENTERYDLLITDQTMPVLTGLELIKKVRCLKPNFPVILCTGYNDFAARITPQLNINGLVLKPIKVSEMVSVINKILIENAEFNR